MCTKKKAGKRKRARQGISTTNTRDARKKEKIRSPTTNHHSAPPPSTP